MSDDEMNAQEQDLFDLSETLDSARISFRKCSDICAKSPVHRYIVNGDVTMMLHRLAEMLDKAGAELLERMGP